jgi:hypothetical protein
MCMCVCTCVHKCAQIHMIYKVTQKKRELLKCVVATMYSWQNCGTGTLSYRQPRHLVIMDQWNSQQRDVTKKFFYVFGFLQFLLGFSKVPIFFVSPSIRNVDQDSSVSTATDYGLDSLGIESQSGQEFPHPSRPVLGPTQPPIQLVPGLFPGVKWPGHGIDHPPPFCAKVKETIQLSLYSPSGPS